MLKSGIFVFPVTNQSQVINFFIFMINRIHIYGTIYTKTFSKVYFNFRVFED